MKVTKIVANIQAENPDRAESFYEAIFGLKKVMDVGWIRAYSSGEAAPTQINIAQHSGADTPMPDFTIEVDDLDTVLERVNESGVAIEYGPVTEPWGLRRFFIKDPFGKLVNVAQYVAKK